MPNPTDAAIVRHLAEQIMGWTEQPIERQHLECMTALQFRVPPAGSQLRESGALTAGRGHSLWWNPLTDARSADELLTALREKGYHVCIALDGPEWNATVVRWKEDGTFCERHAADDSWLRALAVAAFRATGGPDAT